MKDKIDVVFKVKLAEILDIIELHLMIVKNNVYHNVKDKLLYQENQITQMEVMENNIVL